MRRFFNLTPWENRSPLPYHDADMVEEGKIGLDDSLTKYLPQGPRQAGM